jgi:hypothetical protein
MWSKIRVGSNVISGGPVARTSLLVSGIRLFETSLRPDGSLAVTADVYDQHGRRIGGFTTNAWTERNVAACLRAEPQRVVVTDLDSTVLLDVASANTQIIVSAMRLGTRDGRFCVLDQVGGLTLRHRSDIGNPDYITGHIVSTSLDRIDLSTTFASARPSVFPRRFS